MSQKDDPETGARLDFARYIAQHFRPSGLVSHLDLIDVRQVGSMLRVVFDGVSDVRTGRFGVSVRTPTKAGDERWNDFPVDVDEPPEEWAKTAVILELLEVYETTAQSTRALPDGDGVIWLS